MLKVSALLLLLTCVLCENLNSTENIIIKHKNVTFSPSIVQEISQNVSVSIESITPSSQTQQTRQIERTVELSKNGTGFRKPPDNFRPSPQLDIQYEYNKFPVIPAYPEAKQLGNDIAFNEYYSEKYTTTEYPWTSKIKFPTTGSGDRPYEFYSEFHGKNSYDVRHKNEEFSFNKPVPIPPKSESPTYAKQYPSRHKTYGGYNLMERPAISHKTHGDYGLSEHDKNPWKKIIHILTAFIPIGLLISALTPTVITVTNTNDTVRNRYRMDDKTLELKQKLLSSMPFFEALREKGCEERILCELLLAASTSSNPKENVKNFLDNFSEQRDVVHRTEDLKTIFEAVRNQNCSPIICKNIKKPT